MPAQVVQSEKWPSADDDVTERLSLYGLDEVVALGDCRIVMNMCQHFSMCRHGANDNTLHGLYQGTQSSISQPSIKLNIQGHVGTCKQFNKSVSIDQLVSKCSKAGTSTPNQFWVELLMSQEQGQSD